MLKSLDILIGLSVVMLVVSMAVTLVTQFFLTMMAARGRHLLRGLADLFEQLHPGSTRQHAESIANLILTSPTIRAVGVGPWRLGDVIHREALTKLLLDLGAGNISCDLKPAEEEAVAHLRQSMAAAGITDPKQTLENVRMMALQLEKASPEMAANVRHNIALLQEASSNYLGKINFWFDQTIDRVTDRFTINARAWTFISATIIALSLQLDTVSLVNKLSMDDKMRAQFVELATKVQSRIDNETAGAGPAQATPPATAPAPANPPAQPASGAPESTPAPAPTVPPTGAANQQPAAGAAISTTPPPGGFRHEDLEFLQAQGVVSIPISAKQWWDNFALHRVNPGGILISILLLSLGAPFWYTILGKLLQLRSLLAQKDDEQRTERQTSQAPASGPAGAVLPAVATGERGDLTAIG